MMRPDQIARRAELMAELFLEELEPTFASKPETDVGWDLLAGFPNGDGGTNVFAVQVKGTDRPVGTKCRVKRDVIDRMAHSNLPGLLLVADVKQNKLYYAWLAVPSPAKASNGSEVVAVPVTEVAGPARQRLTETLVGPGRKPVLA